MVVDTEPPSSPLVPGYHRFGDNNGSSPTLWARVGRREHSEEDWEAMKNDIENLYIRRNNSLKTVMEILSGEPWCFRAT